MEKEIEAIINSFVFDFDQRKLEALDKILFSLLLKKELMLFAGKNTPEIQKIERVLSRYHNYRDLILKRLLGKGGRGGDWLIKKLYLAPARLILLVTRDCQLRCKYCRIRKFPASMREDVLYKAIDLIFTSNRQDLQIQFFGGEPLLRFDLVKKGVEYAQRINRQFNRDLTFMLTTNGIALDKEKTRFLKEHNFLVECSIDGEITSQLRKRKAVDGRNYYSHLIDNLKGFFRAEIPHYSISVVTPQDASSAFKTFKYLGDLGFKRLQINYSLGVWWPPTAIKEFFKQTAKIIDYIKKRPEVEFINLGGTRREPVVLNAELTVDCEGGIFLESGISLEENFMAMKKKFLVTDVSKAKNINLHTSTQFQNFYQLSKVYSETSPKRRIILNNVLLGKEFEVFLKKTSEL